MLNIVLYPPGSAGNMVSSVIDPRGTMFTGMHCLPEGRAKLIRNFINKNMSDDDLDEYLSQLETAGYLSVPSHLFSYHIRKKHRFILITSTNEEEIDWCRNRYHSIWTPHRPNLSKILPSDITHNVEMAMPYAAHTISVTDIWSGNLINKLSTFITTELHTSVYDKWLTHELNSKVQQ